jgi:hypothetical protein
LSEKCISRFIETKLCKLTLRIAARGCARGRSTAKRLPSMTTLLPSRFQHSLSFFSRSRFILILLDFHLRLRSRLCSFQSVLSDFLVSDYLGCVFGLSKLLADFPTVYGIKSTVSLGIKLIVTFSYTVGMIDAVTRMSRTAKP